jgi:hypothetical protein
LLLRGIAQVPGYPVTFHPGSIARYILALSLVRANSSSTNPPPHLKNESATDAGDCLAEAIIPDRKARIYI